MSNHAIVTDDGIYGDVTACNGHIVLAYTDGSETATVHVESSDDDGATWNEHYIIRPADYRRAKYRKRNLHHAAFVRPFVIQHPLRMRIRVEGIKTDLQYWLEATP